MPSTPNIVHGVFALGSFSAAIISLLISIKLGALQFIQDNLIDGFCTDVWDGFFLSSKNLIAIGFLLFLPIHCYTIRAPSTVLCLTTIMGIPSILFLAGILLEISPVALPIGIVIGAFGTFGLSELRLARGKNFEEEPSITTVGKSSSSSSFSSSTPSTSRRSDSRSNPSRIVQSNSNSQATKLSPPSSILTHPTSKSSLATPASLPKRKRRES